MLWLERIIGKVNENEYRPSLTWAWGLGSETAAGYTYCFSIYNDFDDSRFLTNVDDLKTTQMHIAGVFNLEDEVDGSKLCYAIATSDISRVVARNITVKGLVSKLPAYLQCVNSVSEPSTLIIDDFPCKVLNKKSDKPIYFHVLNQTLIYNLPELIVHCTIYNDAKVRFYKDTRNKGTYAIELDTHEPKYVIFSEDGEFNLLAFLAMHAMRR